MFKMVHASYDEATRYGHESTSLPLCVRSPTSKAVISFFSNPSLSCIWFIRPVSFMLPLVPVRTGARVHMRPLVNRGRLAA